MLESWTKFFGLAILLSWVSILLDLRGSVSMDNLTVTWETVLKGKSLMVQAVGVCVEFLLKFRRTVDGQNVPVRHTCYMIAPRPDLMY